MSVPNYPKATASLFQHEGLNSLVSNLRGVSKPYKSTNGLFFAAQQDRKWFDMLHGTIAPTLIIVLSVLFFLWWSSESGGGGQKSAA